MIGTIGIEHYPCYIMPLNYYEDQEAVFKSDFGECYRLVFVEDGRGSLTVNNKKIAIQSMTLLCLNEKDMITNINFVSSKLHVLYFLPTVINNKLSLENINSMSGLTISDTQDLHFLLPFIQRNEVYMESIYINMEIAIRIKYILNNLKEQIFIQNDSWPCLSRSYILELFFLIERTYTCHTNRTSDINSNKIFRIDDVLIYLHNNYMNKITIEDLTKRFNTNRTTLSKEFKNATGYTIIEYIIKIRIEIASGMLRDTALNVDLIAERVGFNNITHFDKVFRAYNQCLPKEYRKNFKPYERV